MSDLRVPHLHWNLKQVDKGLGWAGKIFFSGHVLANDRAARSGVLETEVGRLSSQYPFLYEDAAANLWTLEVMHE